MRIELLNILKMYFQNSIKMFEMNMRKGMTDEYYLMNSLF